MFCRTQFDHCASAISLFLRPLTAPLGILILLSCAGLASAQEAPPGTVGRIEGNDVSVEGGMAASNGTATAAPSIFVASGGVVTVHSGQARMILAAGGELEICGPAKLTVLQSSDSITIALNFGRVHVELPASTVLRIFTPSIIATPIDISGAPRDIVVGLNLDNSLCVLATSGALGLEHQFTGERLIVPQAGEFFLMGGQLVPAIGAPGSCQCTEMQASAPVPAPPSPLSQTPERDTVLLAPLATAAAFARQSTSPEPGVSYSVLGHANETHPVPQAPKNSVPPAPAVTVPIDVAVAPLAYSAGDPAPPDASPDVTLLIREARVDPDWKFSGRVQTPDFTTSMQRALGVSPASPQSEASAANQIPTKQKKKGGFWAGVKRIFVRSHTNRAGD